jgi:DNA-binding CsgD family transcriptional regulator
MGTGADSSESAGMAIRPGHDDEAALVAALFAGVSESPLWATFLNRLRLATGADHAILVFQPPGRRLEEGLHLLSGGGPPSEIGQFFREFKPPIDPPHQSTSEGLPYSLRELLGSIKEAANAKFYRDLLASYGISAVRQMRVRESTGVDAWLTITSRTQRFSRRDEALLRRIAPVLRGVLQLYVAMETERFAASLTAEAVRRLQFGWLTLDGAGRVLDCDEQAAMVLSQSGVLSRGANGRLSAQPPKLEREIGAALSRVAKSAHSRPRAVTLRREPWLDMLLVPARGKFIHARGMPVAIAYVHGDNWRSIDRCEQLAELFALSPREARLALALSRGMSLAEAASEFGLTLETVRTYSKSIYTKTGARGQPDLVRIVMRSVLAVAPSA